MDRSKAERIISDYESLLERAIAILNAEGPPWGYVSRTEWARLSFEDDDAVVRSPDASTYYDSVTIDTEEARFPAALLFMPEDELAAWKTKATKEYEADEARRKAEAIAAQEVKERANFEALKRKYGN